MMNLFKAIWCFLAHSPTHWTADKVYHPWIKPHGWVMKCRKCGRIWLEND
jgi:hypothetical protein